MDYAILWLVYLALYFLLIATISAYEAHLKSIFLARLWPILAFVLFFIINLVPVVGAIAGRIQHIRPAWLLPYSLSFFVCFTAGSILILYKGLKKSEDRLMAYQWPRARLSVASGIVFCVFLGTLHIMHLKVIGDQNRLLASTMGESIKLLPARVPDYLNAGKEYDKASKAFSDKKKPDWFEDCLNADFIPESEEVAGFITDNQEVLDLLKQAGDKPGFNLDINPSMMFNAEILNFRLLRDSMRLEGLSAKLNVLREGPEAALAELETMKKLSEHLYHRITIIDHMVACAIDKMRASTLEFVLSRTPFPEKGFIATPIKPSFSIIPFFQDAVRIEHVSFRQALALFNPFSGYESKTSGYSGRFSDMVYRVFMFKDDLESLTEIQKQEEGAFEKPFPDAIKILNDLGKSFSETFSVGIITKQYMLCSPYFMRVNEAVALRRLIDLALAATAYKAEKGNFPASLEVLAPDYIETLPNDPFDEKPMKLNAMDGGLDIYSVGASSEKGKAPEAIHFYLGAELYNKYRYQPALAEKKTENKK